MLEMALSLFELTMGVGADGWLELGSKAVVAGLLTVVSSNWQLSVELANVATPAGTTILGEEI